MESTLSFKQGLRKIGTGLVHMFVFHILSCFVHCLVQRSPEYPQKCCLKTKVINDKILLSVAFKEFLCGTGFECSGPDWYCLW